MEKGRIEFAIIIVSVPFEHQTLQSELKIMYLNIWEDFSFFYS